MTTSPSQAVEAAVQELVKKYVWEVLQDPMAQCGVARKEFDTALRAALTSQQEVAAPAMERFSASIGDEQDPVERLRFFCSIAMNGQDWIDVEPLFDALAASRVPVASLASREQGVEAVGAVPDKQIAEFCRAWEGPRAVPSDAEVIERCKAAGVLWCEPDGEEGGFPGSFDMCTMAEMRKLLYTAPPSSKTQDDLAGAESGGLQDRECEPIQPKRDREADRKRFPGADFNRWLDESITENGEFSVWDLIPNVACAWNGWTNREHYSAMPQLASQPKAPAPVPVVQGERLTLNNDDFWFLENAASTVEDAGKSGDQDADYSTRQAARLREIKKALFATPANMAVGAVGGVGADVVQLVRWAYEDAATMVEQEDPRTSDWMWDDRNDLANAIHRRCEETIQGLATPAPEQATTGSGQGVTDAQNQGEKS